MQNPSHPIKALVFDFGGVLMRTENSEPRRQLADTLNLSMEELMAIVFDSEEGHLAEIGQMSSEERWRRVTRRLGLNSPHAWQTFPREFFGGEVLDAELTDYVRRLRRRYKTALLSNASESLHEYVHNELGLDDCFDTIIVSALVGVRKPDPAIYRLVLDRLQVAPHEAVFIDDLRANVEGAASIGMHAIQFTTRDALFAELRTLLGEEPHEQGRDK